MPETNTPREQASLEPYATAIHMAVVKGDLAEMKALAARAQQFLTQHGDVSAALEALKLEIAKLEARGR